MKLKKVIEVLEDLLTGSHYFSLEDHKAAVKISGEAVKRVQDMRISPCTTADELLPGETKK